MRFLKKAEFDHFKEHISAKLERKIEKLDAAVDILETRLDREVIGKGEQYSAGCAMIEKRLKEHMVPIREDIDIIMKSRARQHSDDILA